MVGLIDAQEARKEGLHLSAEGQQGNIGQQATTVRPLATAPDSDNVRFLRAWLSDPLHVAAVAPSGQALARLMTSEIVPETGHVIELGPGTGAFTRALLERGIAPEQLTLVESSAEFVRVLALRFPDIRVLHMDAARLRFARALGEAKAGAIVSGLPLLSMPPRKVLAILSGSFANMQPTAGFYQFTYGFVCPVARPILDRLNLRARRIGFTLVNAPPASVYRFTRRRPATEVHPFGQR